MPYQEKIWFLSLYLLSGVVRASILLLPMKRIHSYLGRHYQNQQLCVVANEQQQLIAKKVGRICTLVGRYTPWESKCLVQATLAKTLFSRYQIPYVLHLGVTPVSGADGMKAHAWISVGPKVITGGAGHQTFIVVATFVSPSVLFNLGSSQA